MRETPEEKLQHLKEVWRTLHRKYGRDRDKLSRTTLEIYIGYLEAAIMNAVFEHKFKEEC